jgi:hypothetical protein
MTCKATRTTPRNKAPECEAEQRRGMLDGGAGIERIYRTHRQASVRRRTRWPPWCNVRHRPDAPTAACQTAVLLVSQRLTSEDPHA